LIVMPGTEGQPGRSAALIIATGQYQDPKLGTLASPAQDAAELARVLEDPAIGGLDVRVLVNTPGQVLREEIEGFFVGRRPDDLLVLYLSCHGVKDLAGRLHFAAATTKLSLLASTGITADFVYQQVEQCRARKILLLLDCCYSGAYLKGHRPRAEPRAVLPEPGGQGRAVITSCTALEHAFEIDTGQVTGPARPSVFTSALVEGLRTGKADRDGDGLVSVDELYAYTFDQVREITPHQTPEKLWTQVRGDFVIARNPLPPPLPDPSPDSTTDVLGPRRRTTTRRAALALGTASAAGITVAAWDNLHRPTAPRRHHHPPATPPTPNHTMEHQSGREILWNYVGTCTSQRRNLRWNGSRIISDTRP
jgi:Caspase domain